MAAFRGVWTQDFWRAVFGELLAMTLFVLMSLGSTIPWGAPANATTSAGKTPPAPPPDLVLISLCFGLAIATLVQCFGHLSGAHINPAVTVAMVATRKLSLAKGMFYVGAQCGGAMIGAALLYVVTPEPVRGGLGVTKVRDLRGPISLFGRCFYTHKQSCKKISCKKKEIHAMYNKVVFKVLL